MSEEAIQSQEVHEREDAERDGLSEEQRERRVAALAEVRSFGDPALRSRASDVSDFEADLAADAERMIAIMQDALGVGLAATQLGIMRRILVFQAGSEATPTALVNPQLEWLSGDAAVAEEGCLSLPGIAVDVERALHTRVRGQDVRGEPMLLEASGLEARVLQHEIDHLDGVLILDRTPRDQRKGALRALREGTTYAPPRPDDEDAHTEQTDAKPAATGREAEEAAGGNSEQPTAA